MTHIALYAHSLNSHVNDTLREASGPGTTVLVTNVHYSDDAAMRELLARKHADYRPGTEILYTPHGLVDTLLNLTAETVIVDSLNFVVSNLLLLYNSDEAAIRDTVAQRLREELDLLAELRDTLAPKRLIFITSDVDHDLFIRSRIGKNYRAVLHAVNDQIALHLADEYAILLNGARLPLTPSARIEVHAIDDGFRIWGPKEPVPPESDLARFLAEQRSRIDEATGLPPHLIHRS